MSVQLADVLANRALDKILSMYNEDRLKEAAEQRKGLTLAALFPKPRPIWLTPALIGTGESPVCLPVLSLCLSLTMCRVCLCVDDMAHHRG